MNTDRWPEIERILDLALDRSPSEWDRLLDVECGADDELREEVSELLAQHRSAPSLLASGPGAVAAALVDALDHADVRNDPLIGSVLGAWRVVREIGRGGMSRVYLAERHDGAFAQRAAVKVLRAGLDSPADVQRFHSERQILASLDHPYIARLLDGGVTPDGRPFLVLEYVEGVPLTTWSEDRGLDLSARLRLMLSIAEATQSAHRRLIVHRDLKPSNILVDADGRPRLLDFGISKMLTASGSNPDTITWQRWLSPAYAAPEQFTSSAVTTATDVYQLGAILYELLAGRKPYSEQDALKRTGPHTDPPPASSANPALRGDLDAIISKAMRREPEARYATVAEFADDLRRVLDGEPVMARTGDRAYRWRRLLRQNAWPVAVAAAVLVMAAVYTITISVQNRRISRALAAATIEREKSDQVTQFMLSLFSASDARAGRSDTITARTLLARGEERANALNAQPLVQAQMLDVIGRARTSLGAFEQARASLERALAIRRREFGESHIEVVPSILALAQLDHEQGRYPEAAAGFRAALAQSARVLGDTAEMTHDARFQLASTLHASGEYALADSLFDEWAQSVTAAARAPSVRLAMQLHTFGELLAAREAMDSTQPRRAEQVLRTTLAMRRSLHGPTHVDVAFSDRTLALVLWRAGRKDEAEPMMRQALATLRTAYPDGHPDVATLLNDYASMLTALQRHTEALQHHREAVLIAERVYGDAHVLTGAHTATYGNALRTAKSFAEAESVLRVANTRLSARGAEGALMALRVRLNLGDVLGEQGRGREAESVLLAALRELEASRGKSHRLTKLALQMLVREYERQGRTNEAERLAAGFPG